VAHEDRAIISLYGPREDGGKTRFHRGVDIAAPKRSKVVATAPGRVVKKDRDHGGYGKYVIIEHGGGYRTLYAHLSWFKTREGKRVKRGERIGLVGKTGRASRPHVHYEVHRNGEAVDPRPFL
jgi:murein DD-endopeptidase MepM/ murein hydrolase activator NlpD